MIIVTTQEIPGARCYAVRGIVHHTHFVTKHAIGDAMASIKNFFGGNIGSYARLVELGRHEVLKHLEAQAHELSANAIIGLSVDIELMSLEKGGFFMISGMGTAVLSQPLDM